MEFYWNSMTQTTVKKKNTAHHILPIQELSERNENKQSHLKQLRDKRKIARPPFSETYVIINIVTFSLIMLGCFISYNLLFNPIASESTLDIRSILAILFLTVALIMSWYIRQHLLASLMYRDGLIYRLNKEISNKKRNTENDDKRLQHLIESTNVCPWNADLKKIVLPILVPKFRISQVFIMKYGFNMEVGLIILFLQIEKLCLMLSET